MRYAFVLSLAASCASACASNWVEVENASAAGKVLVDVSSLQTEPNKRTVWTRVDLAAPRRDPNDRQKVMQSMLARQQFDCAKQTVQALQIIIYGPNGDVVAQHTEPDPVLPVVPNTTVGELFEFVCSPRVKGLR